MSFYRGGPRGAQGDPPVPDPGGPPRSRSCGGSAQKTPLGQKPAGPGELRDSDKVLLLDLRIEYPEADFETRSRESKISRKNVRRSKKNYELRTKN